MSLILDSLRGTPGLDDARQAALDRAHADPGIPDAENTTKSFWLKDPHPTVARAQSPKLPQTADIVLTGSGVAGASVAYHLLSAKEGTLSNLSVVLLDARDACSGATGRNGGHILPGFEDYSELKSHLGQSEAQKIIRLRLSHLDAFISMAEALGITDSTQARRVQAMEMYNDVEAFEGARQNLTEFKTDMPAEAAECAIYDAEATKKKFGFPYAAGVILHPAGAVWPYKLVTGVLAQLQHSHKARFSIETNTPVKQIATLTEADSPYTFQIHTNRGNIRAKHIIHCTNGHVGSLLPGLRGVVVPTRAQMSAQAPGDNFGLQGSKYSWIFQYAQGFDYLTQLPVDGTASNGEMMFGGGINTSTKAGLGEIGLAADDELNSIIDIHLSGGLRAIFGAQNWGAVSGEQVKAMWTGTLGMSTDSFPWVGKVPSAVSQRQGSDTNKKRGSEWVVAGFSGEGMAHAWACGRALANMVSSDILGEDIGSTGGLFYWFPSAFLISERRVKNAKLGKTLKDLRAGMGSASVAHL